MESGPIAFPPSRSESPVPPTSSARFSTSTAGTWACPSCIEPPPHGYQVVMVGLPGDKYHLEFTSHDDGSPGRAPTDENLLVFYFATADQMFDVVTRLGESGHEPVELDNPWWRENGAIAFADPDNWRIVLMPNPIPLAA